MDNTQDRRKYLTSSFVLLNLCLLQFLDPAVANNQAVVGKDVKHFVLVHGACHGGWTWYKLVALLASSGHYVTAIDLAASGTNPKQAREVPLLAEYIEPLMKFMAGLPSQHKVILVGHGFGGFAVSQAMEMYPEKIQVAVFVSALMPGPSLDAGTLFRKDMDLHGSFMDSHFTYDNGPKNPPTTLLLGPKFISVKMYYHSPIEDFKLATLSLRPIYLYTEQDISKAIVLSTKKYGSVKRVFIVSDDDKVAKADLVEFILRKNPPNEVKHIPGSDHMLMFSMPIQLSQNLRDIAFHYS